MPRKKIHSGAFSNMSHPIKEQYLMLTSIKCKSVVVTGGSSGIGLGIAKVFGKQGAKVTITSRSQKKLDSALNQLIGLGYDVSGVVADVSNLGEMNKLMEHVNASQGGIDILCCNAGIFPSSAIESMSESNWDEVLSTNAKGTFFCVKAALPYLKHAEYGRIILTSSITGPVTGYAGWSHYAASKAAQLGFMRSAALELAKDHITVNAVLPGNILTEGLEGMGEQYIANMAASIPLKKLGSVDDIAYAALFLSSKEAGYITGQTIIVDGGQILPESLTT